MVNQDLALLALLRGERVDVGDWAALLRECTRHGVAAFAFDRLGASQPPRAVVLQWAALTLQMERRYRQYAAHVQALTAFYVAHGFEPHVLKGYALSLLWPVPAHRPAGDIDVYLGPRYREADALIARETGCRIDRSHHHHTVFLFRGETVENHFDFFNVHAHRSTPRIEAYLKRLAEEGRWPLLHLLFVLRHAATHFASNELILRQALDWAYLAQHTTDEALWQQFYADAEWMGMTPFTLCLNDICVRRLGFPPATFHTTAHAPEALTERVLHDILHPEPLGMEKHGLAYALHRLRLWRRLLWKHRLVYTDTPLSTFLHGLYAHLLHPATFFN